MIRGKFKLEFVVVSKRGVKTKRFLPYDKEDKCVNQQLAGKSEMAIRSLEMKQTSVNTSFLRFSVYQEVWKRFPLEKSSSKANRDFLKQFFLSNTRLK